MIIKSYAKINLALNVLGKTSDNFHKLDMIMIPVDLHDSIEIIDLKRNIESYIVCDSFDKETKGYSNTCIKILKFFNKTYHFNKGYEINIMKEIPMAAGLGGGSSNAGALFRALCMMNKISPTKAVVKSLAREIGSDVPFFVYEKPARVTGVGDEIEEIKIKPNFFVLIVMPSKGLSTKCVFEKSDEVTLDKYDIDSSLKYLQKGDIASLNNCAGNALEKVSISLVPDIKKILEFLKERKVDFCQMSGSGSSVFAISKNERLLQKISKEIKKKFKCNTYLTKPLNNKKDKFVIK